MRVAGAASLCSWIRGFRLAWAQGGARATGAAPEIYGAPTSPYPSKLSGPGSLVLARGIGDQRQDKKRAPLRSEDEAAPRSTISTCRRGRAPGQLSFQCGDRLPIGVGVPAELGQLRVQGASHPRAVEGGGWPPTFQISLLFPASDCDPPTLRASRLAPRASRLAPRVSRLAPRASRAPSACSRADWPSVAAPPLPPLP